MEIKLKQGEIERALRAYLTDTGISVEDKVVTFTFSQRRQPTSELIADVDISVASEAPAQVTSPPPTPKTRKRSKPTAVLAADQEPTSSGSEEKTPETPEEPAEPEGDPAVTSQGEQGEATNEDEGEAPASNKVSLFS